MNRPLRLIVFASGNGTNFEAIQTAIINKELNAEVLAVMSDKEKAYVHTRAKKFNIPSFYFYGNSKLAYETKIVEALSHYDFDYIICAGYMRIIDQTLLSEYPGKFINIHPSDLPKYKGLNALQQALDAGESEIGISVHYIDETLDGGKIIDKTIFPIDSEMTIDEIESVLHEKEHKLYVSVIKKLGEEKTMKKALLSVSDKEGLDEFAKGLIENQFEIISTGNTYLYLLDKGIEVKEVSSVTGFPEMLDGRVKTLHPKIHGGILARRDMQTHMEQLKEADIDQIDLVCVNLYPFKETILKDGVTFEEAIENIDIGGPTMLRSAAKNFKDVTVITDKEDYMRVLDELRTRGETSIETRQFLAMKVFNTCASYDALITEYFKSQTQEGLRTPLTLTYDLKQELRYGENPHQKASLYTTIERLPWAMTSTSLLHGKELSYNNIQDGQAALDILSEFDEPTCVVVKHMNPCGVASASTIDEAYIRAYEADPISIFGGIVAVNGVIDHTTAERLNGIFLEVVLAIEYTPKALEILKSKKNIRLLTFIDGKVKAHMSSRSLPGGLLVQEYDTTPETEWKTVTNTACDSEDLEFAQKIVKHVKSNAIVLVKDKQTVGIGAGQMNRVGAAKIACEQANEKAKGAIVGSDAFFPMRDSVDFLATYGVSAIVQPGGSIKDQESIDACNEHDIAMIFTGVRHFKH